MEEENVKKITEEEAAIPPEASTTNFWFHHGELRTLWRICVFISSFILLCILFNLLVGAVPFLRDQFLSYTFALHASTLTATIFVLRVIDDRTVRSIGLELGATWRKNFRGGILISMSAICAIVFIELLVGIVEIEYIHLSLREFIVIFVQGGILYFIVGFGEEILFRGYCFQALMKGINSSAAIVLTSIVFSLVHFINPHMTFIPAVNILLAGVWFGLAYVRTKQLWLPVGLHIGWNFMQGTIFGFPVSGISIRGFLFSIERGDDRITGGVFGPEGGLLATCLILIGIMLLYNKSIMRLIGIRIDGPSINLADAHI